MHVTLTRSRPPLLLLSALLLAACEADAEDNAELDEIYTLLDEQAAQLSALAESNSELSATVAVLAEENAALKAELSASLGGVDLTDLADAVSQNTTTLAAVTEDYLTRAALSGYATEGFVSTELEDYATEADLGGLSDRVSAVESDCLLSEDLSGYATETWVAAQGYGDGVADLRDYVTVDTDANTVTFSGANVYIQSGSGSTDDGYGDTGTLYGLGNLVIGYDEDDGGDSKTGSHNLVIGAEHTYTAYAGLVSGEDNTVTGTGAAVLGGLSGEASGQHSAVLGSYGGEASGKYSVVSGGFLNTAKGGSSTVSGGAYNYASATYSAVSGGLDNEAGGQYAVVSGGLYNLAGGSGSAILGGHTNTTSGSITWSSSRFIGGSATVSGGRNNTASGQYSAVSGGDANTASGTYDLLP